MRYDLCLPWQWEYGAGFVHFGEDACIEHGFSRLTEITQRIASICRLDWFSTEIAITDEFIVADYVNAEIDTRIQSQVLDGVPDEVIKNIANDLVMIAKEAV